MSTDILATSSDLINVRYFRLSIVSKNGLSQEDLADYIRRLRNEKGLSLKDIEARSHNEISKGYVGQIENRDVFGDAVSPKKLSALAKGLGVDEEELFRVARGLPAQPLTPTDFYSALDAMGVTEFNAFNDRLTPDEMEEVIEILRATINAKIKRKKKK